MRPSTVRPGRLRYEVQVRKVLEPSTQEERYLAGPVAGKSPGGETQASTLSGKMANGVAAFLFGVAVTTLLLGMMSMMHQAESLGEGGGIVMRTISKAAAATKDAAIIAVLAAGASNMPPPCPLASKGRVLDTRMGDVARGKRCVPGKAKEISKNSPVSNSNCPDTSKWMKEHVLASAGRPRAFVVSIGCNKG